MFMLPRGICCHFRNAGRQAYLKPALISRSGSRTSRPLTEDELELLDDGASPIKTKRSGRSLYHAILVQLKLLPDELCASLIKTLVWQRYIKARAATTSAKFTRLKQSAKKCLVTLQKANLGDPRAFTKVLENAYGQRGKYKYQYMNTITSELTEPAEELIPGNPRSRPPVAGLRLQALWQLQFEQKKLRPVLPEGPAGKFGKPLDKRRQANLMWQHHTSLLEKTLPPIPDEHLERLQAIAEGTISLPSHELPEWRQDTLAEMNVRLLDHGTDPHHLRNRGLRRLYAKVLSKSPVLTQKPDGTWSANYAAITSLLDSPDENASGRPASDFEPIENSTKPAMHS